MMMFVAKLFGFGSIDPFEATMLLPKNVQFWLEPFGFSFCMTCFGPLSSTNYGDKRGERVARDDRRD